MTARAHTRRRTAAHVPARAPAAFQDRRGRIIIGTPSPAPCPFCNQFDDVVIIRGLTILDEAPLYRVTCERCAADGPLASSRRTAAALWNRHGVTEENRLYRLLCGPGEE
jgi:Lar family restriction alleviation protein